MENKTVREILHKHIVIPEIQREYVWGQNRELVRNFLTDLNKFSINKEDYHLGFLYSYEKDNELRLIDGQQRMTTIILLALFCAKTEGVDANNRLSMFSYRVRTDTDEYLKGLIFGSYLTDASDFRKESLLNSKLYHAHYINDVTINTMIATLDLISNYSATQDFKISYNWIMDHVRFWTFEVQQTSQGEELYISMNSRGEALTSSELIKPRMLEYAARTDLKPHKYLTWGKAWDEWEDLIFSSRGTKYPIKSVSLAFDTFLNLIKEMLSGAPCDKGVNASSDVEILSLDKVEQYFESLACIIKVEEFKAEVEQLYEGKDCLILKILIALSISGEFDILRIYKIIKNWERRGLLKNAGLLKSLHAFLYLNPDKISWLDFIIHQVPEAQNARDRKLDGVIDHHEIVKIELYQSQKDNSYRDALEKCFHEAENNTYLSGYIRAVWDEAFEDNFNWTKDSLENFNKRYRMFINVFNDEHTTMMLSVPPKAGQVDNNLLTRALLSIQSYGKWVSGKNYAYGWKSKDGKINYWRDIAGERSGAKVISELVDHLLLDNEHTTIYDKLDAIIDSAKTKYDYDNALYYIINYPMALRAWNHGHNVISFEDTSNKGWENFNIWIVTKDDARSYYFNMFCTLLLFSMESEGRGQFKRLDQPAIVFENGLQIRCSSRRGWDIIYRERPENKDAIKLSLLKILGNNSIVDNEETQKHFCLYVPKPSNVNQIELGKEIFNCIKAI